jgi:hypothetical protein
MKRSEIRGDRQTVVISCEVFFPDYAALHPGYGMTSRTCVATMVD